jgi:hypothetical protein
MSMSATGKIRIIQRADLDAFFDGLVPMRQYVESDRSKIIDDVKWWVFDNPSGEGVQAGFYEGGTLAGITYITPKSYLHRGNPIVIGEIGGTETSINFRGRGIFSTLAESLVSTARERGYAALYGTPNDVAGPIWMGKLGWTGVFHWRRQLRPVNWRTITDLFASNLPVADKHRRLVSSSARVGTRAVGSLLKFAIDGMSSGYETVTSLEILPDLVPFLQKATQASSLVLNRTDPYLRWRFSRPGRIYRHVYVRNHDALCAWAVYSPRNISDRHSRALVGDYWIHPWSRQSLRALMSALVREAHERQLDELYFQSRPLHTPQLNWTHGLLSKSSLMPVIVKPFTLGLDVFSRWDYRDADADMF